MTSNRNVLAVTRLLQNFRQLHCSHVKNRAYEGPGRTTATILNSEFTSKILINKCSPMGFVFNNNSRLIGPLALFPKTVLCWDIGSGKDINEQTLSLFLIIEPKLDILILGLEKNYEYQKVQEMKKILIDRGIKVEILPVDQACGIYNFLCEEGRYVAAGLIPPLPEETYQMKLLKESIQKISKERAMLKE
ncbi:NADH dehydrogenase [ubiquinone] 1 alpha subcomplex assembly factor 3 [Lasioglossum baleicum]|uniref:NADH dehydrogenase [ubiquinone] 1 alpha subcomplex assembly factor 3 n=1 Tax=Lasioglossum baleicum TaxID=434251 RepID=UPI003FCE3060